MAIVVPIRFKEEDIKKIDALVKAGMFKSRSEAVRSLSIKAAEDKSIPLLGPEDHVIVRTLLRAMKARPETFQINIKQDIAKFIAEGRGRL
ncbi:MAG: ribbon-helix-helix domain-containing protein [Candidatus Ranarchaeia archaeon]